MSLTEKHNNTSVTSQKVQPSKLFAAFPAVDPGKLSIVTPNVQFEKSSIMALHKEYQNRKLVDIGGRSRSIGKKCLQAAYDNMTSNGIVVKSNTIYFNTNHKKEYGGYCKVERIKSDGTKEIIKYNSEYMAERDNSGCLHIYTGRIHGGFIGIDIDIKGSKNGPLGSKGNLSGTNTHLFFVNNVGMANLNTLTCVTPNRGYHYVYQLKYPKVALKKMNTIRETNDKQYIENQPNIDNLLHGKNYVVIDPGLSDLIYCMDRHGKKFRYTQNQRRFETKNKKYNKKIQAINAKTKINGKSVQAIQSESSKNSKTCHFDNFTEYLKTKNKINFCLTTQYQKKIYRRLKWYRFINTQRSESKLIKNFEKKFGKPANTIVIMGDYDNGGHNMRGKEPAATKRIRNLLRLAEYKVYLINEFRTSKLCHKCHCETETFLQRASHKPKSKGEIKTVYFFFGYTKKKEGFTLLYKQSV